MNLKKWLSDLTATLGRVAPIVAYGQLTTAFTFMVLGIFLGDWHKVAEALVLGATGVTMLLVAAVLHKKE